MFKKIINNFFTSSSLLLIATALLLSLPSTLIFGTLTLAQTKKVVVNVTAIVEHPALDSVRDGVRDYLQDNGYQIGKNLIFNYKTAQGNPATVAQITRSFIDQQPDVIVAISTPSAQSLANIATSIPIIFSAVTDPVGAKIIPRIKKPGGNITGVSDISPIDKHLKLIRAILPQARNIGIIYNPGEANSVSLVKLIKQYAPANNMKIIQSTANKSSEVFQAARKLVGSVDAIYIPTDNTVVSAFETVTNVANENNIPLFAGDTSSVKRGALAALGFNYYDVGVQTGKIVLRVLNGEKPGDIDAQTVSKTDLYLNKKAAKNQGVVIPEALLKKATKIIE